jgi:outer membrane protein assembly factor BamB
VEVDSSGVVTFGDTANSVSMPQEDIPWPSLADSPWPMSSVNPQGLSRSSLSGPQIGEVVWTIEHKFLKCEYGPAIGPDGTIYFVMNTGFAAVTQDGEIKWSITDNHVRPWGGVSISADSIIYGPGRGFRAFREDGTMLWERFPDKWFNYTRPLIGIDGTIYTKCSTDGTVYALNKNGTVLWELNNGRGAGHLAASPDGNTIYAPGDNHTLYALDAATGAIEWFVETGLPLYRGPSVDNQGNIYYPGADRNSDWFIFSLTPSGTIRWQHQVHRNKGKNWAGIQIDHSGYIYTGWNSFLSLDYEGHLRYRLYPGISPESPPFIDGSDRIYLLPTGVPIIFCYSQSGHQMFSVRFADFPFCTTYPAAMKREGELVFGTNTRLVYAVR